MNDAIINTFYEFAHIISGFTSYLIGQCLFALTSHLVLVEGKATRSFDLSYVPLAILYTISIHAAMLLVYFEKRIF